MIKIVEKAHFELLVFGHEVMKKEARVVWTLSEGIALGKPADASPGDGAADLWIAWKEIDDPGNRIWSVKDRPTPFDHLNRADETGWDLLNPVDSREPRKIGQTVLQDTDVLLGKTQHLNRLGVTVGTGGIDPHARRVFRHFGKISRTAATDELGIKDLGSDRSAS